MIGVPGLCNVGEVEDLLDPRLAQLAGDEEGDPAAVGRPEGEERALGAGERLRGERVEGPDPQARGAGGVARREDEQAAVRPLQERNRVYPDSSADDEK